MKSQIISFSETEPLVLQDIFGYCDEHLRWLEQQLAIEIRSRGNDIQIIGRSPHVEVANRLFQQIISLSEKNQVWDRFGWQNALREALAAEGTSQPMIKEANLRTIGTIQSRTYHQGLFIDALAQHEVVFGIGPAGTGKTFLAIAHAVEQVRKQQVGRIMLSRPAVEAGERLGFLPGDLNQKVDPYLKPIFDALHQIIGIEQTTKWLEKQILEIAPLAYMRGRTLHDAVVLLDEAQNTTPQQMKMFLTRFGAGSQVIVTGDPSQIDLPVGQLSGLQDAIKILSHIPEIAMVTFDEHDVVRHPLVAKIVSAYLTSRGEAR